MKLRGAKKPVLNDLQFLTDVKKRKVKIYEEDSLHKCPVMNSRSLWKFKFTLKFTLRIIWLCLRLESSAVLRISAMDLCLMAYKDRWLQLG